MVIYLVNLSVMLLGYLNCFVFFMKGVALVQAFLKPIATRGVIARVII